ncbi:formate/nitrite transporter family protein [Rhodococcus tukisamuensis]|uniref:Formate/nitrite transporter n=1 Tax=Rhodococcus tukisamuensis TaxID=168276 RepID=A0A1G6XHB1_9NOCA|nr:formate/nitrite transporter family protein [Rhodococcus tukisamuensis]SDD76707.1 formate/nitrite transporter [Rhodococcus tukisamuensis]
MSYVPPAELARSMVDAGQSKVLMSTRDTLIRGFMGGALLTLAAAFAVTVTVQTGSALLGAVLFPVGFCLLYLLGFDLLTGVFTLTPIAYLDKRPGVTVAAIARNWALVFVGNFAGAFTVAVLITFILTYGYSIPPNDVAEKIMHIGEARTVGYAEHGAAGMMTLFLRGVLCNWMVSTGVVAAMMSKSVPGKVLVMWMPVMLFFYMGFEHSVVNMFLFPAGLLLGADFSLGDYLVWNEIPTVLGNLVGGVVFVGLAIYTTHVRTQPKRVVTEPAPAAQREIETV